MLALIDFASVCTGPRSDAGVRDALDLVAELISEMVSRFGSGHDVHEVQCRLYGGWRDVTGKPTEHLVWVIRHLGRLRGLRGRMRIVPTVAEALACAPRKQLRATYRNRGQKMVDGMLAMDAHRYARFAEHSRIIVVSDDDDFVPVVLAITVETDASVVWLRQRTAALNDDCFDLGRTELVVSSLWA